MSKITITTAHYSVTIKLEIDQNNPEGLVLKARSPFLGRVDAVRFALVLARVANPEREAVEGSYYGIVRVTREEIEGSVLGALMVIPPAPGTDAPVVLATAAAEA